MSTFSESIERLRAAERAGRASAGHAGTAIVPCRDLRALLKEFERVEKLVDGEFAALGDGSATKLVASTGVPVGCVVVSDDTGRVVYVGPLPSLPPFDQALRRLVMNVHPDTLAVLERAMPKEPTNG